MLTLSGEACEGWARPAPMPDSMPRLCRLCHITAAHCIQGLHLPHPHFTPGSAGPRVAATPRRRRRLAHGLHAALPRAAGAQGRSGIAWCVWADGSSTASSISSRVVWQVMLWAAVHGAHWLRGPACVLASWDASCAPEPVSCKDSSAPDLSGREKSRMAGFGRRWTGSQGGAGKWAPCPAVHLHKLWLEGRRKAKPRTRLGSPRTAP